MTQTERAEEKKRLYELIAQSYTANRSKWEVELFEDFMLQKEIPKLVDDRLDGGVIVPPCKVGDTVWCIFDGEVRRRTVVMVYRDRNVDFGCVVETDYGVEYAYNENDLGFLWFLTKEEAEQALKERET